MDKRWITQLEGGGMAELGPWEGLGGGLHVDRNGHYWFNDETESDLYGPYLTQKEAATGMKEYAATLQRWRAEL